MSSNFELDDLGKRVVASLAQVLEKLCQRNDSIPLDHRSITKFHALRPPAINVRDYLDRIGKFAACSGPCFVLSLIYIDRIIVQHNFVVNSLNVHRLVITAVMLAAKFFDDQFFKNTYYAKVGGVPCHELNSLEVEFLFLANFNLYVREAEYAQYITELFLQVGDSASILELERLHPALARSASGAGASGRTSLMQAEPSDATTGFASAGPGSGPAQHPVVGGPYAPRDDDDDVVMRSPTSGNHSRPQAIHSTRDNAAGMIRGHRDSTLRTVVPASSAAMVRRAADYVSSTAHHAPYRGGVAPAPQHGAAAASSSTASATSARLFQAPSVAPGSGSHVGPGGYAVYGRFTGPPSAAMAAGAPPGMNAWNPNVRQAHYGYPPQ